jgi:hypothetical protein
MWLKWKASIFSRIYTQELLRSSQSLLGKKPSPSFPRRRIDASHMSSILFVGDIMWEDFYLVPELERICPVTTLNLRPLLKNIPMEELPPRARDIVSDFIKDNAGLSPALVFIYLSPRLLSDELFEIIKKQFTCPIVGMNLDNQNEFLEFTSFSNEKNNYQYWARLFDANLTSSKKTIDWYLSRQLPVYYMPQGFRRFEELGVPSSINDFKYPISFLGGAKTERRELVSELARRGVQVKCFGSGWPDATWVDDPNTVFRQSMLNLGIGISFPMSRLTCTKGRDFECPGIGGCYLTQFNWELTEHWEVGKEILCYSSVEELIEIYSYYRVRPEECLKVAQAAWRRGQACHTWEKRFREFFDWLSIDIK